MSVVYNSINNGVVQPVIYTSGKISENMPTHQLVRVKPRDHCRAGNILT